VRTRITRRSSIAALASIAILAGCVAGATASVASSAGTATSNATLVVGEGGHYVRNFNLFAPGATDPTRATIYEPLWIVSYAAKGAQFPWLATAYTWSKDLKTLTFTIRRGVRWSDGQPMTAADVYYTLNAGRANPLMNQANLWGAAGIASGVSRVGKNQVAIHFKQVDTTAFAQLVNNLYIVPKHIYAKAGDIKTWTNPNPVGTGPFTKIKAFSSESIDLGRNPYYWQPGKPAYSTIRFVDNTNAVSGLESGQFDWDSAFVPNVQKVYDDRNQSFHHYYASASSPVVLYMNLTNPLFSNRYFRMALSMAINRKTVIDGGEFGDAGAADATGLNGLFPDWVSKGIPQGAVSFNLQAAKALLQKGGFSYNSSGKLMNSAGNQVSVDLLTNADFPDYVADTQIIAQDWSALGVNVTLDPKHWGDWYGAFSNGHYDVGISYTFGASTPTGYYDLLIGGENNQPVGTPAGGNNYSRYHNAAFDKLIAAAKKTADKKTQLALVSKMEKYFVRDMPVIPVFNPPVFYQYNTSRFTGWPVKGNYYVNGAASALPDRLVVMTRVHPKG
jgi:peptide/nickel transport system substrate-binding protein